MVDDLKCKLKETLEFEDIWVTRQEQKCILEDDRICDTLHELEQKTKTVYKVCLLTLLLSAAVQRHCLRMGFYSFLTYLTFQTRNFSGLLVLSGIF